MITNRNASRQEFERLLVGGQWFEFCFCSARCLEGIIGRYLDSVSDLSLTATIVLGDQSHVWRYFLKIRTSATQQCLLLT